MSQTKPTAEEIVRALAKLDPSDMRDEDEYTTCFFCGADLDEDVEPYETLHEADCVWMDATEFVEEKPAS